MSTSCPLGEEFRLDRGAKRRILYFVNRKKTVRCTCGWMNAEQRQQVAEMKDVLAVVLAGGKGTRLEPLTRDRAKPAVPFGGAYRIIDFTLSNCLNSGIKRILMLTQYKAMSLDRHICNGWRKYFCRELGEFIDLVPPQQRVDEHWYQGTADAVYQNIYSLEREQPELVLILAGDHIYKMDYSEMVRFHGDQAADLTIAALEVDQESARQFGVMEIDSTGRIIGFEEKPAHPKSIPGKPGRCLASMGIYIFGATFLYDQLLADANCDSSQHDFGKNIIPSIIESQRVYAYPFADRNGKSSPYWRDVGTLDAYYRANMDLIEVAPELNVYDSDWPIRSQLFDYPPPKFVFGSDNEEVRGERVGMAVDSIVCSGSIISGGRVDRSILGSNVRINSYSKVTDSILFDAVEVGRNARIQRAIVDKNVKIPPGATIGFDREADLARGFHVTEQGITVIRKSHQIEAMLTPPTWMRRPVRRTAT